MAITLQIFTALVLLVCVGARATVVKASAGIQEDGGICTGAVDELGSSAGTSSSDDMVPKQQSDTQYGVDPQPIFSRNISTEDLNVQATNYIHDSGTTPPPPSIVIGTSYSNSGRSPRRSAVGGYSDNNRLYHCIEDYVCWCDAGDSSRGLL